MKYADCYHLTPLRRYKKFLEKCSLKKYSDEIVLHRHHVIPRHIQNISIFCDEFKLIVKLSVEDHVKAHILLAECFDKGTYEYLANMRSARILNKSSIRDKTTLNKIKKSYIGVNNPFYGKTHSDATKHLIAENSKQLFKGVSYDKRYGKNKDTEKLKRSQGVKKYWDTVSQEDKVRRAKNISESNKGKTAWNKDKCSCIYVLKTAEETLSFNGSKELKNYLRILNEGRIGNKILYPILTKNGKHHEYEVFAKKC